MKKSVKSKIKKHLIVLKKKQFKLQVAIKNNHDLIIAFDAAISQYQYTQDKMNNDLKVINDAIWVMEAMI